MAEQKFDQGKIADLARQFDEKLAEVENLRRAMEQARQSWSTADAQLDKLRSDLTRAVDGHLDMKALKQKAPQSYEVTTP